MKSVILIVKYNKWSTKYNTLEQKLALSMINIMTLGRCQAVMLKTCSALYFNKYENLKSIYVNIRRCVVFSFPSFFPGVQYELPCQIKVSISNNIYLEVLQSKLIGVQVWSFNNIRIHLANFPKMSHALCTELFLYYSICR